VGTDTAQPAADAQASFDRSGDGILVVHLAGAWHLRRDLPDPGLLRGEIDKAPPKRLAFDSAGLAGWDSGLLTFLLEVSEVCAERKIPADRDGLPSGVRRLLDLAEAVPERQGARQGGGKLSWLGRLGTAVLDARQPVLDVLVFIGQITLAVGRLVRGKARFRLVDLMLLVQQAGAQALGIITLISFLVGLILAFVGRVSAAARASAPRCSRPRTPIRLARRTWSRMGAATWDS
jgi:phospholipid/cholesterol/gamma-HCH transport system permease protein